MARFKLTLTLEDAFKRKSVRRFDVEAADFATALTNAATFASDYADIADAQILKYEVGQPFEYSDTIVAGANIDAGITLTMEINNSSKEAAVKVPSPDLAVVNADGTVNLTHTKITTLMSHFLSGFVLVSDGEVVTALKRGKLDR